MFDLGMTELLLIGVVSLIVVGPKDLPKMFRAVGQFTGKARGMAREFTRAMESAADEAGVKEINKTLRAAANPRSFATDKLKQAAGVGPAGPIPAAGTPIAPAAKPAIKPGGATEALTAERAAVRERLEAEAQARAIAKRGADAAKAAEAPPPQADEGKA